MVNINDKLSIQPSENGHSAFYMCREVYVYAEGTGLVVKSIFPSISDDLGYLNEKGDYIYESPIFAPAWPLPGPVVPAGYWTTATFDKSFCCWVGEATVTYTDNTYTVSAGSRVYCSYGWVPAQCQITECSLIIQCSPYCTEYAVAWPVTIPVPFTEGDTVDWSDDQWTVNGRYYDEYGQEFEDDYGDDGDRLSGCVVHSYSTNVPYTLGWLIPDKLCLGIEAEFVYGDERALLSGEGKALFKADSSCGVELVSVPLPPAEMLEFIDGLEIDHLKVDSKCGVHIHISRKYLSQSQLGGLVVFMNHPDNLWYVETVANRSPNSYCKQIPGKSDTMSTDRYEMVNLTNSATVEIRIFAGTNSKETLKGYVEWLLDLLKWLGTNPTSFSAETFIAYSN